MKVLKDSVTKLLNKLEPQPKLTVVAVNAQKCFGAAALNFLWHNAQIWLNNSDRHPISLEMTRQLQQYNQRRIYADSVELLAIP